VLLCYWGKGGSGKREWGARRAGAQGKKEGEMDGQEMGTGRSGEDMRTIGFSRRRLW